ncbi:MAG TPA: hypothetical protein DIS98_05230 [Colwellia sp.]|nr:hypothetical protein [Colwellia sp.]|tara:strand:- start:3033 stop:4211 length:1179 start_codon:yes stop_codon:yes gene_type:complete
MKTLLFNSHDIVLLVVCYICFLFATTTLFKRHKSDSTHLWLAFFLLSQAGISAYVLALYGESFHTWSVTNIPWVFEILELTFWLEGPLLVLYTRSAIYQQLQLKKTDLLLLLPLLIYVVILIIVKIKFEADQEIDFLLFLRSENIQYYEHLRNIIRIGFSFWAFMIIQDYQNKISVAYSNLESVNYTWLKRLVVGFIVLRVWAEFYLLLFTVTSLSFGHLKADFIDFNLMGILANYGQLILISSLLFFALSDPRNIHRVNKEIFENIVTTSKKITYSPEQIMRVCNHMEKQRPYLNNQLKIDDLAQQVSLSPKLLSNLINREFNVNFFEYINNYRLKEVCSYLIDPAMSDQSIIDLAFLAGYNSKSSFNRLFKMETNKTPSQYRKDGFITPY